MDINLSMASYPMIGFLEAMQKADNAVSVPVVGQLSRNHVQICPQNKGVLTEEVATELLDLYPETQFRLHANVRVLQNKMVLDWADWGGNSAYWNTLISMSKFIKAPAYTAHAGLRCREYLSKVFDRIRTAEQRFGIPVGVEHHYPTKSMQFLLSTWEEMRELLNSGVKYAIDLSHIMILVRQTKIKDTVLLKELLASENCIEVHLSWNDGVRDQHYSLPQNQNIWWWCFLGNINKDAVVFFEGNLERQSLPHG